MPAPPCVWRSKIWLGITRISALMALENPVVRTSSNQSNLGWTLNWTWGSVWEIFWTLNWTWGSVLDGSGSNWSSGLNFSTTTIITPCEARWLQGQSHNTILNSQFHYYQYKLFTIMFRQCVGLRLSYYQYCNFQLCVSIVWVLGYTPMPSHTHDHRPAFLGSWATWP